MTPPPLWMTLRAGRIFGINLNYLSVDHTATTWHPNSSCLNPVTIQGTATLRTSHHKATALLAIIMADPVRAPICFPGVLLQVMDKVQEITGKHQKKSGQQPKPTFCTFNT